MCLTFDNFCHITFLYCFFCRYLVILRRAAAAEAAEAAALHERLVAHVRALSGEDERGVWGEHSYARARAAPPAQRVLLAPPPPAPAPCLDVLAPPAPAPALPDPPAPPEHDDDEDDDDDDDDEQWEERMCAAAPGAEHARLVRAVGDALRDLRLQRAARAGSLGRRARREGARQAARRLRRALAPCWGGAAGWLLGALPAALPRALRRLLDEALGELRRAAPRLAARLPPARAPSPEPLDAVGPALGPDAPGPWLAWAPSGCAALDERFARRLGALLHTRRLAGGGGAARAAPDRWCAARAAEARAALSGVLAAAGARPVVLGGAGAGAALAAWLAAEGGVRALLQLAPSARTAEGAPAEEGALPRLAVRGGAAGAAGGARRELVLAGADEALRLPARLRARLALPQQALDAAVAEECARWASDVTDPAGGAALGGTRAIEIVEGRSISRATGGSPLALPAPRRAEPALAAADIMQLPIVFADDEPPLDASAAPAPPRARSPPAPDLTVTSGNPRGASPPRAVRYARVLVAKRARLSRRPPGRPPLRPARD
ncbi:uncharacterized protein LOC128198865 isoform X2 [Bicyclus anynana]|uniref:Uncharacterized protein LOC128198865 isoform X2 n=1 Tax=Bicyclus anynana TaxID=110368 RepID=A0ABM3LT50_BICAN|nr:uncharacterized protein LOC128198865 isoform X2 [Bicyclus anynana]